MTRDEAKELLDFYFGGGYVGSGDFKMGAPTPQPLEMIAIELHDIKESLDEIRADFTRLVDHLTAE